MGVAASQMERKGIRTDKGNHNREVANFNKEIRQTKARIRKVKTWLFAQPITNPPSFIDVMNQIANAKNLNTDWKRIANLKTRASILVFLQNNKISDMEQFVNKVTQIHEDLKNTADKITKTDRRLDTLALHLFHVDNHKKHKNIYKKYQSLAPENQKPTGLFARRPDSTKQDAFYEKHAEEIQHYENAVAYFNAIMNGRKDLPISKWQEEQKKLASERFTLAEKYYRIKEDVKTVEAMRRGMEGLIRDEVQRGQSQIAKDIAR